jgi:methyl-accepting chemotaxis protein
LKQRLKYEMSLKPDCKATSVIRSIRKRGSLNNLLGQFILQGDRSYQRPAAATQQSAP